jgi:hypothetical protein
MRFLQENKNRIKRITFGNCIFVLMSKKTENKAYDKILKENVGEFFLSLSKKYLGLDIVKSEELKDKLQTTLEKEADFLRIIQTVSGEKFILHLEFQTANEKDMIYRMQEYFAILQKKFQLPVKQFVIYLGQGQVTMRTSLPKEEIFTGFELKNLSQLDYQTVLYSDIPEEIILAILCDFKEEEVQVVLHKIITRLQALSKDDITLQKYIRQILLLSRLRNLTTLTTKQLKDMAIVYDIEKDPLYKEGVLKGELRGEQKGELRKTIQGVKKALDQNLSISQITIIFDVREDFVLKVQKGEIK